MPDDFFTIGLAEVLIRGGQKGEGEKLISDIIGYSKAYLEYAVSRKLRDRFALDYPIGINMQALLDIYNISVSLKMDTLTKTIEPDISKYYNRFYSTK